MRLGELLDPARVLVPLQAGDVRDATKQLARALVASGVVVDAPRLSRLLEDEWPEDIVAVEGRAFLPHFRTEAVKAVAIAIGVTPVPIGRGGDPHRTARVIVLVVAPIGQPAAYLRTMAAVAHALSSDDVLAALHTADDPEAVLAHPGLVDASIPEEVTVADVMTRDVTSVGPDTPLAEAAQLMLSRGVRAVPVVGPQREVIGLLNDGHLLRYLLPATVSALSTGQIRSRRRRGRPVDVATEAIRIPVREAMDRSVLCLSEDQTIADVAALMLAKEVDRFPVTREGVLAGFLTRGDIVRKLLAR